MHNCSPEVPLEAFLQVGPRSMSHSKVKHKSIYWPRHIPEQVSRQIFMPKFLENYDRCSPVSVFFSLLALCITDFLSMWNWAHENMAKEGRKKNYLSFASFYTIFSTQMPLSNKCYVIV